MLGCQGCCQRLCAVTKSSYAVMVISGIAVVSSIAIPVTVSLSLCQFQVSHNASLQLLSLKTQFHPLDSKLNIIPTFDHLIINTFFTGNYHVEMLAAVLESFWLRFNATITIQHSKQAVLRVAAWQLKLLTRHLFTQILQFTVHSFQCGSVRSRDLGLNSQTILR